MDAIDKLREYYEKYGEYAYSAKSVASFEHLLINLKVGDVVTVISSHVELYEITDSKDRFLFMSSDEKEYNEIMDVCFYFGFFGLHFGNTTRTCPNLKYELLDLVCVNGVFGFVKYFTKSRSQVKIGESFIIEKLENNSFITVNRVYKWKCLKTRKNKPVIPDIIPFLSSALMESQFLQANAAKLYKVENINKLPTIYAKIRKLKLTSFLIENYTDQ